MRKILAAAFIFLFLTFVSFVSATSHRDVDLGAADIPGVEANTDLGDIITNAFTIIMIVGVLAVILMLAWGAFEWVTSGGEKDKLSSARGRIVNAIIGVVLLALTFVVGSTVGKIVGVDVTEKLTIPSLSSDPQNTKKSIPGYGRNCSSSNPCPAGLSCQLQGTSGAQCF